MQTLEAEIIFENEAKRDRAPHNQSVGGQYNMSDEKHHQTSDIKKPAALLGELCRHCGGRPMWLDPLVDGAHPICQALRPLEELLDATDDPSIEDGRIVTVKRCTPC